MSAMFDSVIVRERVLDRRLGGSVLIVVFLHAAALVSVMSLTKPRLAAAPEKRLPPFVWLPPRAALPLLGGEAHPSRPTTHRPQVRRDILVQPPVPTSEPTPKSQVVDPTPAASGPPDGDPLGDENGKPDGKRDGARDGIGTCTGPACPKTGQRVLPQWPADLPAPKMLSGPEMGYPLQALEHEIEGVMVVRCNITATGHVQDCRVLKSLPFMDRDVVDTLEQRVYAPATSNGQPIDMDYTFKLHFNLPQ
jgi:protein TonB